MCVRETSTLADETIEMRCRNLVLRVVGLDVTYAEVIGEDDNDVGCCRRPRRITNMQHSQRASSNSSTKAERFICCLSSRRS
jgi:hypothetical protein